MVDLLMMVTDKRWRCLTPPRLPTEVGGFLPRKEGGDSQNYFWPHTTYPWEKSTAAARAAAAEAKKTPGPTNAAAGPSPEGLPVALAPGPGLSGVAASSTAPAAASGWKP
jgi:hypothetical protein